MAGNSPAALDLGQFIQGLQKLHPQMAPMLQKIQDAVNNLAQNLAVSPTGMVPPPSAIQSVNVKTSTTDGTTHVTITDNSPISKGLQNFVEYDTDPAFSQPHVVPLGASRGTVVNLPAQDDSGAAQTWYVRGYTQYPGSVAGPKVNFGGNTPAPIAPGGTTKLTLLPSTGSGTASPSGQQGGQGLGNVQNRPVQGPKRSISPLVTQRRPDTL